MNEAAALPSPTVVLSARLKRYYGRLRLPPGRRPLPGIAVYRTPCSGGNRRPPGRGGSPQFPPPPSERSAPSTPGSSSGLRSGIYTSSMAFALKSGARLSLAPANGGLSLRRGRLHLTLRTARSLPPKGLSTLGFDPTRFQTEPPACYRASRQLPGPDSHRQATTSLCWITIYISTSNPGRTSLAKYTLAALRISLAWRSSRTSPRRRLHSSRSALDKTVGVPPAASALAHPRAQRLLVHAEIARDVRNGAGRTRWQDASRACATRRCTSSGRA
jgi:hypothetical protein